MGRWPRALFFVAALLGLVGCRRTAVGGNGATGPAAGDPFQDVTAAAGINYRLQPAHRPTRVLESVGSGCAFFDADGDGYPDILLVGSPRCALYRNRRDGTFEDVTARAHLDAPGDWVGCATGDYDNDGREDLFLTGYRTRALYRNTGGEFRNVTEEMGIRETPWSTAAAFADFDRDGYLDLYVGAYASFGPNSKQYCVYGTGVKASCRPMDYDPIRGQCYRNRRGAGFEEVTKRWGLDRAHGRTLGIGVADFDHDGWPDLYLADDEIEADLFHNNHGRGFTNVAATAGVAYGEDGTRMGGMGVDWGDLDNDGWQDLLVGTYQSEPKGLFRNLGGKVFEPIAGTSQLLAPTFNQVVWGSLLFDFDRDGWSDLLFVNGHVYDNVADFTPNQRYRQPSTLFRNDQKRRFTAVPSASLAVPIAGRGVACGDYRNRGVEDLLIADMDGPARLLRNTAADGHHWLRVETRGVKSNRDGIGALIRVTAAGVTQTREVRTARSYVSSCDPRALFGLGAAARVERLLVEWPSGTKTELRDLAVDRAILLVEGKGEALAPDARPPSQ